MEETIEQKVIRNVQGHFAIFKTPEVVGNKTMVPNIEWEDSEDIDKFFMFAKNLGAKVIYLTEGEEEDEETGQTKNSILQIGFVHDSIMHHINFVEDEDDDEEEDEEEYEEEDENVEYEEEEDDKVPTPQPTPTPQTNDQFIGGGMSQAQQQAPPQQPQQNQYGGQPQEKVSTQQPPQQNNYSQNNF